MDTKKDICKFGELEQICDRLHNANKLIHLFLSVHHVTQEKRTRCQCKLCENFAPKKKEDAFHCRSNVSSL